MKGAWALQKPPLGEQWGIAKQFPLKRRAKGYEGDKGYGRGLLLARKTPSAAIQKRDAEHPNINLSAGQISPAEGGFHITR